ncbi:MAG: NAD-dependent DNA ligase LigA [Chlamydiae bacterium]|nr:NAD-dependent DNA ligase LigA [Chlamydiota bacterium]
MKTREEYARLVEEAKKHDALYYVEAKPLISDYEYDRLIKSIEGIEKEHPEWILTTSPTQAVSSDIQSGFKQVEHVRPMLSLMNTYSEEELSDFVKRMEKILGETGFAFMAELKIDGIALSLRYEKGKFVRAVTRGDGKKGDDVTENVRTIKTLPHELKGEQIPDVLELRGEVFMPLAVFYQLNKEKEEAGEDVYANPRNAAAGSLKLLDPNQTRQRSLAVIIYDVVDSELSCQSEIATYLKQFGLPVFSEGQSSLCKNVSEILSFAKQVEEKRGSFLFEIDGIVVKFDELAKRDEIGFTGKSPKWAVAYKFAPEQAITKIENITVQVGRTGVLTPVAELKPVKLAGSTISRATLHNQDEIDRKDIRIGDTVIIEKGGDVIPKVVLVDFTKRLIDSVKWSMPLNCPSCHEKTIHIEGEVAVRCVNPLCGAKNLKKITFFAAKDAMDIDHLGEKVIEKLVNKGFVKTISDIYELTPEKLGQIEGFKEKSVKNVLESIEKSKETTLARFIFALGIKHIGEIAAEAIADTVLDLDGFLALTEEKLLAIEGIGKIVSESVMQFLSQKESVEEIHRLIKLGVKPKGRNKIDHPFSGKTFVLTGTLKQFGRSEAAELIKERGGKVSNSVGPGTDYLIVGEEAGSKLEKAKKLGITILDELEFFNSVSKSI